MTDTLARDPLDTPITELIEMSGRLSNCCRENNIETLRQFASLTAAEWLRTPKLGKKTLNEIRFHLASLHLCLGMTKEELRDLFLPTGVLTDQSFIEEDYT